MVLPSLVSCMSSSVLAPLTTMRVAPPAAGIISIFCRPRSSTVKNRALESGDQVKLSTQRSSESVSTFTRPVARSSTSRRQRSLS